MAFRVRLFANRLAGLVILIPEIAVFPVEPVAVAFVLFLKEERSLAALVHEVAGKVQVLRVACNPVEPHEGHLDYRVPGITVDLAILGADDGIDVIHQADHGVQQDPFPGDLIIRNGRLDHMAGAVQFMVVLQVGPAFIQAADDVIRVQIAVGLLGCDYFVNGAVNDFFKFGIRMPAEGPSGAFDPLGDITVLENITGVLSLHFARGDAEVPHTAAGFGAGDLIIEGFPLIRDAFAADRFTHTEPERIRDADMAQVQHRFTHDC